MAKQKDTTPKGCKECYCCDKYMDCDFVGSIGNSTQWQAKNKAKVRNRIFKIVAASCFNFKYETPAESALRLEQRFKKYEMALTGAAKP